MQVTETKNEDLHREFRIVLPAADIAQRVDGRLAEFQRTAQLPGFRPGKVPLKILRQRFGRAVLGEALDDMVKETADQVVSERGLRPAAQPRIEAEPFDEGQDLAFALTMEVLPEVEPIDFSTIELERLKAVSDPGQVRKTLERLAGAHKSTVPAADGRAAASGDVVVIDFVGTMDGVAFPGGKADGYRLELGSESFIPGFEDQLVGTRPGDSVSVQVTFPADYGAQDLAGKAASFEVAVKEVLETAPCAIDDDLAGKVGMETLAELEKAIGSEHEKEHKEISRMRLKRDLLDVLAERYDFAVPQSLVEQEFEAIWGQVEQSRKVGQTDPSDEGKSDDELREEYRALAVRRVRLGLVLAEVGRRNSIQVAQDDINRALSDELRRYPGHEEKVLEFYRSSPQAMQSITAPILEDKVIDFILEMAKINTREVPLEELLKDPGETAAVVG